MTAVHTEKDVMTRGHFAPPTIGVKTTGEGETKTTKYAGITPDFYKSGFGDKDDKHSNSFAALAALDPSPTDHVEAVWKEKCMKLGVDPMGQHLRASAIWDWAEKAATLERHLLACDELQDAGGLKRAAFKDFFGSASSAALFPAFVESQIAAGLLETGIVDDVVMSNSDATSNSVTVFDFNDSADERSQSRTTMGAELTRKEVTTGEGTLNLGKYGLSFAVPYEMRSLSSIDVVSFHIRRIGQQIAIDQSDDLMDVTISGDGTGRALGGAETNATDTDVAAAGTIAYSDMLTWVYNAGKAYDLKIAIGGATDLALIANLAEFKDPDVGRSPSRTQFKSPLSFPYRQWDGGATGSAYVDRLVVGIDTANGYRGYTWGPNIQETDRLIENQLDVFTFSHWRGFSKIDLVATQVLDTNAAL